MRNSHKENREKMILESGRYIHDFIIRLTFTAGKSKHVIYKDFLPLFQQYVKGHYLKYFAPANFKKFIVKDGNIYWGKNEDVIFSSDTLLDQNGKKSEEEILYVI